MKNFEETKTMAELKQDVFNALRGNDEEKQKQAFNNLFEAIAEEAKEAAENKTTELYAAVNDSRILIERGVQREFTSEEKKFFNEAVQKKKMEGLDTLFPKTIVQDILKDLQENHPVISLVDTQYTEAVLEFFYGEPNKTKAFWGAIPDNIKQILLGSFKKLDLKASKLSAFIAVPKSYFELGPVWLANYVVIALREAMEATLEDAIINGDGKDKPLGMTRKLSGDSGGVYPEKTKVVVNDLKPKTLAGIRATLAKEKMDNGGIIWLVNPTTYWAKFFPNLAFQTPDGRWVNTILPTGEHIVTSYAVPENTAVVGNPKNYLLAVAGKMEIKKYHETLAIEDLDLFIGKSFVTGIAKNPNAFFVLDVSGVDGATPVAAEGKATYTPQDTINPKDEL